LPEKDLELEAIVILYDRDLGLSIFQNFRGYNSLIDDAEWLLERSTQKSRGFILRPIRRNGQRGMWIGEYDHGASQIRRQEFLFDEGASTLAGLISSYASKKISEKRINKIIAIEALKNKLNSMIVKGFKYYSCPPEYLYQRCVDVKRLYGELVRKYGRGKKISYALVAEEIEKTKPCEDVIVCPLMVPNLFERVLNLNKALKSRKLGEIRFLTPGMVEIT